jgi:hypothetical protein
VNVLCFNGACGNGFKLSNLIPQVSLGLNALVGAASASVFLDLDASLGLRCGQGSVSSAANPQPCLSGNTDINVTMGAQGFVVGFFDALTGNSHFDKNFRASSCSSRYVHTAYYILFFSFRIFIILSTRRQQCFGGNLPGTRIRRLSLVARQTPLRFGFSLAD